GSRLAISNSRWRPLAPRPRGAQPCCSMLHASNRATWVISCSPKPASSSHAFTLTPICKILSWRGLNIQLPLEKCCKRSHLLLIFRQLLPPEHDRRKGWSLRGKWKRGSGWAEGRSE